MSRSPSSRHHQGSTYDWPSGQLEEEPTQEGALSSGTARRERTIELLTPRFAARQPLAFVHQVVSTDRLDLIAARYYGDPLQAWRIVDANPCKSPDELLVPGRLLRIPRSA